MQSKLLIGSMLMQYAKSTRHAKPLSQATKAFPKAMLTQYAKAYQCKSMLSLSMQSSAKPKLTNANQCLESQAFLTCFASLWNLQHLFHLSSGLTGKVPSNMSSYFPQESK
ncbi:hypothetical protein TB2_000287 [Malus domestica]